ncbi:hypothetical protein [Azotobacter beijerinckii]|uniref:hypothetical protein n=1 Tax=Azotobacter beijerinckii TaxID=170623 RepID=UPI0015881359|nr:hypothetical protein [Azotobacter beijerinckii]
MTTQQEPEALKNISAQLFEEAGKAAVEFSKKSNPTEQDCLELQQKWEAAWKSINSSLN